MKIKFEWNGTDDAGTKRALMVKMYGVNGRRIEALETYRIKGKLLFRKINGNAFTLKILANASEFGGGVYTTKAEASLAADPGKRRKGWIVDTYSDSIQEVRIAKGGGVYDLEGSLLNRHYSRRNLVVHKTKAAAKKALLEKLEGEAGRAAAELRRIRARIRRLKGTVE